MADVVLKARDGTDVTYAGVEKVRLISVDGSSKVFEDKEASSAGSVNAEKPIRFYDPYGEILYAYTQEEALALTELPPGPVLSGLTFDQWTHTLEEIQSTTYFANVGPMYKYGSSPATILIVETFFANTSISLNLDMWASSYAATVYWGDGASSAMKGNVSSTSGITSSHTYTSAGVYFIAIVMTSGIANLGADGNSYYYNVLNNQISLYQTSNNYMTGTHSINLRSVLIGSYMNSDYPLCVQNLVSNNNLRFVSAYNANTRNSSAKQYCNCPALKVIAGNKPVKNPAAYNFFGCASLERLNVTGTINATAFDLCYALKEVIYGSGTINYPKMNTQWVMLMTTETPPTIGASSPIWGTKPIYVPDSAVETYKAASKWSDAADYILPASEYHSE